MFKHVQTRNQLLITHIFDASRKTSIPINLTAARRQAHWTKVYSDSLFSIRQNDIRANDLSKKRRSAERRFVKMTFGWTTIRKNVVRHYEVSLIRRFGHVTFGQMTFGNFLFRQNNDSAKLDFGKTKIRWNDISAKWCNPVNSLFNIIFLIQIHHIHLILQGLIFIASEQSAISHR